MADTIDYYFTAASPFVYLGHDALMAIAGRHGKKIAFRPFNLAGVWSVSGAVPLGERSPTRQRYRLVELQRIAEMRGVELNLHPAHFPTNPELADRCIIAIVEAGSDPAGFVRAVGSALWAEERQIADETVMRELLQATGHDADKVLQDASGEATAAIRQQNTDAAIAADAIGAPSYVYQGEVFWGQDRLELLERMIASGRAPFSAG